MDMIKMGAHLIITGLSQLGKNRILEHGDLWNVVGVCAVVKALNNSPGILIQSFKDGYVRWMGRDSDEDFKVISGGDDVVPDGSSDVTGK